MAGREVVTYKRRRLFLRKDHAHVDLNFDAHPKVSLPKDLDKGKKCGKSIVENVLQNKDKEVEKCGEHSIAKIEGNVSQGQSSEKHESMFEMLCATGTKQHDSSALNSSGNCITLAEKTCPANSIVQQITFNANEVLEGSHGQNSQTDSAGHAKAEENSAVVQAESLSMKWGLENEDECQDLDPMLLPPAPPVAQTFMESDLECTKISDGNSLSHLECASVLGAFASEETDNLNKDQCSDLHNDLSQKRKLTSTLLTYKRNKRPKSIPMLDIGTGCAATKCASDTPPGADCSVDRENKKAGLSKSFIHNEEKEPPEDTRVLAPATEAVVQIEDSLHPPVGASTDALVEIPQDSGDKGKACIDDDGKDINPGSMSGSASKKRDSVTRLDLSLTPHASQDIDCNRPLDDNFLTGPSEVHPVSVGLTSKGGENMLKENSTLVRAVTNKGKLVVDQPPALAGTLSKHNYLQLFPENVNAQALQLANHLEMSGQLRPTSSLFRGVSVQPEVMANAHHAAYPAIPELPYLPAHHGQSFHDFLLPTVDRAQPFPRHQMLLDRVLTRARAARGGNQSSQQTTWSEEELDCLWIGVRRHGRGNWDAISGDRRLQFSPWKTTRDLAEKWQEEQSQLFSGARYACPPDVELSLGYAPLTLYDPGAPKRPPVHFMNIHPNRPPQEMYASAGTLGSYAIPPPTWVSDPSAGIPPRPSDPAQVGRHPGVVWLNQQPSYGPAGMYFHPGMYNPSVPVQRRTEPQAGGKRPASTVARRRHKRKANKQDNPIVIPSDASSEETISDDRTMKA